MKGVADVEQDVEITIVHAQADELTSIETKCSVLSLHRQISGCCYCTGCEMTVAFTHTGEVVLTIAQAGEVPVADPQAFEVALVFT